MRSGLSKCPKSMGIILQLFSTHSVRYIPWHANDNYVLKLHHESLKTLPPIHTNQTVIDELDKLYQLYDKRLTTEMKKASDKIDSIEEEDSTTMTLVILYVTA
jgi:hypothetical protein